MLVVAQRKAVILTPRDPAQILALLPRAKPLQFKGRTLVAVPHSLDETKVLHNLGIRIPAPIEYYYNWPGLVSPFEAQKKTAAFIAMHNRAFVLNDLGTGKTLSVLWAYDYLRSIGRHKSMLVVCPRSTMNRTWADELFTHFPHLTVAVLAGTAAKRKALLKIPHDVYIVNHDGLKIIKDDLAERDDITAVVVDELTQAAKNARTNRWTTLFTVINKQQNGRRAAWGLTGSPTPNEPTEAWAQAKLICPNDVKMFLSKFRDMVMRQVGPFRWVPRQNAAAEVKKLLQPSIRFSREDCIDLPPVMYATRSVDLTPEQQEAYVSMINTLRAEIAGQSILAVNEAVKIQKLLQIVCGMVYGENGMEAIIAASNRVNVVHEIIEEAAGKVIVFVPFVAAVKEVAQALQSRGVSVGVIHGEVPQQERDRLFSEFQHSDTPKVLVAQPMSMSHGLTLTAANTIVWYAPVFSNDVYTQACARITRPGQKQNQFIVHIESTSLERQIFKRLKDRQTLQGTLLTLIQEEDVV